MKRLFFSVLIAVLTTVAAWAGRANSTPFTVVQPDGISLTVTLHGDEHVHWLTTTDGTLLVEQDRAYYVAAISDSGLLTATRQLAHAPALRSLQEQQACQAQQSRHELFFRQADRTLQTARRAQVTSNNYFPHSGTPRCLVILAAFSDRSFISDKANEQFQQYFYGETQENLGQNEQKNLVSVQQYFNLSSHGQFTPQFDIVGPVTLPQTMAYYGADSGNKTDVNFSQFCADAISAVDDQVDFTLYDNDGDGRAELVCVIFAGYGQNIGGNPAETIWPKCSGVRNESTSDGVTVSFMNCGAELFHMQMGNDINGIGTFVHELSHGLGLPDLYATVTAAQIDNQSPEYWDLMDYGEHDGNGYTPVPFTAWEQEAMGWTEIEELTESRTGIEMKSLMYGGKAYKFGNGANDEEWFMLEYVQGRHTTQHIPGFRYGHGLLVWHIAYSKSTVGMSDYPNNTPNVPRVCIVPADGLVINGYRFVADTATPTAEKPYTRSQYISSLAADPFPGTSSVSTLSAAQKLPNYAFYNGTATPVSALKNIVENTSTNTVTFDFDLGTTTVIQLADGSAADGHACYTLDGRRLNGTPQQPGLYISNGRKVIVTTSHR